MTRWLLLLTPLLLTPLLVGWTTSESNIENYYREYGGSVKCFSESCPHKLPIGRTVHVCHGSGCEWTERFVFNRNDMNYLRLIFSTTTSPKNERINIAKAVAWAERRVCKTAGTCQDKGGASWMTSKVKGQMECVDETTNTTSYLLVMKHFLSHCKTITPLHRFGNTFPHWAARIKCPDGVFVVDSYFKNNGRKPDIMSESRWSK